MNKSTEVHFALGSVKIQGFRGFNKCQIDLHEKLNVLIAPNSGGKTALLDALSYLLKSVATKQALLFKDGDKARFSGLPSGPAVYVKGDFRLSGQYQNCWRINKNKPLKSQALIEIALVSAVRPTKQFYDLIPMGSSSVDNLIHTDGWLSALTASSRAHEMVEEWGIQLHSSSKNTLPLMAYFTANRRLVGKGGNSFNQDFELNKYDAFISMLPCEGLGNFDEWLRERAINALEGRLELEESGDDSTPEADSQLIAVSSILSKMLSHEVDVVKVKYFATSKSIQAVKKNGDRVNIDQLSHGAKSVLTIAAEIAMNCCALNPHLKEHAPAKTPGIILIDEIDLHLHPKWQQHVLDDLQECFPCMQFIVSTHSPSVLTTVRKENIREISVDPKSGIATVSEPVSRSYGESSGDLQETIMGVSARPKNDAVKKLQSYLNWAENGDLSEDKSITLKELEEEWGRDHADLLMASMILKRREILSRKK